MPYRRKRPILCFRMDVKQVILADYANVSREGKLNVLGIFTQIFVRAFPVVHAQMQLIVSWQAARAESGKAKKLEVQLVDEDGKKLFTVGGEFVVPEGQPGRIISGNHIMGFNGVKFEKPGQHAFHVLFNDDLKGSATCDVIQIQPKH